MPSRRRLIPRPPGQAPTSGWPRPEPDRPGHAKEIHNYRIMRGDSVAMGTINSASTFLPVLIVRLGGSALQVGLLTAIPAVASVLLAIPVGQVLQRQPDIVRWYSNSRMLSHLGYVLIATAVLLVPPATAIGVILAIWAVVSIPSTIGAVSFPVVMDGIAGPRGRLEIMSRRWGLMGLTTAITVAVVGQVLDRLPFPASYAVLFAACSVAGVVSWHFSRQYRVPPPDLSGVHETLAGRLRAMVAIVRSQPAFLRYSARQLVYVAGVRLTLPLIPLYYVRSLNAPDAWIGIIATAQSVALLAGYLFWRRQSRIRGTRFVLLATLLVSALYPALLSLVGDVAAVAVLTGAAALFSAGVDLSLFDELMRRIPRAYGVTFTAIDTTLVNLATIVAPLAGGAIAGAIGIENALRVGSVVTLAGFVLFALDASRPRSQAAAGSTRVVATGTQSGADA